MKSVIHRIINAALNPAGYSVYNTRYVKDRFQRPTLEGALKHLKQVGLNPGAILDVGAAYGTPPLYMNYPDTPLILLEPLQEYETMLRSLIEQYPQMSIVLAAAAGEKGTMEINVNPALDSTSFYTEAGVDPVKRSVPVITLDDICEERDLQGPYLIKADVEGAELDVLDGAPKILKQTECIVLETTLFQFRESTPLIHDVIVYMVARGFAVYDIVDPAYRPLDGALARIDLVFVRKDGIFWANHTFATPEQRAQRAQKFESLRAE